MRLFGKIPTVSVKLGRKVGWLVGWLIGDFVAWRYLTYGLGGAQAEGDLRRDALALHQSLSVRGLAGMGGHAREHQRRVPSDDTSRGVKHLHLLDQDQVAQGTQA